MNPVLTHASQTKQVRTPAGYPAMDGYQVGSSNYSSPSPQSGANYGTAEQVPYQMPAPMEQTVGRPVTWDDILVKVVITFAALLLGAAGGWMLVNIAPGLGLTVVMGSAIIALVLALVNTFKKQVSPALILAYALFEGVMIGGISAFYASLYGGVVPKAIGATIATFLVMLMLYRFRIVRNSPLLSKVLMIGIGGYLLFLVANWVISMFVGAGAAPANFQIFGMPLWLVLSFVAVGLAAFSLVQDFDFAERAVAQGADSSVAWTAAFGLMVTLVWLYIEFLRIFSYFASND